jgi:HEAT repeat protein
MIVRSIGDAIPVLSDTTQTEIARVDAAHFLAKNPDPHGVEALILALDDYDPGVRWAASNALAAIGEPAMPPLLERLVEHAGDPWLREAVLRVIRHNRSDPFRQKATPLRWELEKPVADLSAIQAAGRLLLDSLAQQEHQQNR